MLDINIVIEKINEYSLKNWSTEIGIHQGKIKQEYSEHLKWWIEQEYHGSMNYLSEQSRQDFRNNPKLLFPELLSMIVVRIPYRIETTTQLKENLTTKPYYIAQYAQGRDYHKVVKKELDNMAKWLQKLLIQSGYSQDWVYRTFTDSAPIMEVAIASDSGLGWRGKNTLLIHQKQGSFYFIGELFTSLPLFFENINININHCGSCTACLQKCPTNAIIEYEHHTDKQKKYFTVNAQKCISYWTIEHQGSIPIELREKIGNRLYGCDDCQIYCPWNNDKFTEQNSFPVLLQFQKKSFLTNNNNNKELQQLINFLSWNEEDFLEQMEGSAIRRIGYVSWIRNVLVVLGNFLRIEETKRIEQKTQILIQEKIQEKLNNPTFQKVLKQNEWLKETILWAIKSNEN